MVTPRMSVPTAVSLAVRTVRLAFAPRRLTLLAAAGAITSAAVIAGEDGFTAPVPAQQRWWENFTLEATGTELLGNPLARINPSWQRATLLDASQFTPQQLAQIRADRRAFELRGDFNDDGTPDRAVVGVYLDSKGERGRFVAVFTRAGSETHWRAVYTETGDDDRPFSTLHVNAESHAHTYGTRVYWTACLYCPSTIYVNWMSSGYMLVYQN